MCVCIALGKCDVWWMICVFIWQSANDRKTYASPNHFGFISLLLSCNSSIRLNVAGWWLMADGWRLLNVLTLRKVKTPKPLFYLTTIVAHSRYINMCLLITYIVWRSYKFTYTMYSHTHDLLFTPFSNRNWEKYCIFGLKKR